MKFSILEILFIVFLVGSFVYTVIIEPKRKKSQAELAFENRVMGFIDSLYITEVINCSTTISELRTFARNQLIRSRKLNRGLLEYTTSNGHHHIAYADGKSSHIKFALISAAMYAKENKNQKLLAWCDHRIVSTDRDSDLLYRPYYATDALDSLYHS